MKRSSQCIRISLLTAAFAASFGFAARAHAQNGTNPNMVPELEQRGDADQQMKQRSLDQNVQAPPKVDAQEEAAYKAFYGADPKDADTRIRLGEDFIAKYPNSRYLESVYAALTHAYYAKQDWKDFYATGDKALAINPDDPSVLVIIGWVIPHSLQSSDPEGAAKLDKAEKCEKHAIEVVGTMPKPATMTDDQFTQTKTQLLSQAHSGLGLVYFRRQQSGDSAKELQQATQSEPTPDPTDLFVLGLDLQSLSRYGEAADAFNRCGQIQSALQDRCKQSADAAKKQAK